MAAFASPYYRQNYTYQPYGYGQNYYTSNNTFTAPIFTNPPPTTQEEEVSTEKEYVIGDGSTTAFTFPTNDKYPAVAIYTRTVDGEDDEKQVTVTEDKTAQVVIVQGETITVKFETAPAKRGAVILIG